MAVIVAVVVLDTECVEIVKLALLVPAATVTLDGGVAADELEFSATVAPPDGAAAVSVTVPVDDEPAVTEVGLIDSALRLAGAGGGGAGAPSIVATSERIVVSVA